MKKRLTLILSLLLTACLLSSCAYLPFAGMSDMISGEPAGSGSSVTAADENSVVISREEYEQYKQFDQLLELMDIAEENYYEEVNVQDMLDGAAMGLLAGLGDPYTFY